MAEENIEVSAGCSHERLQFGHALPHLFFFGGGGGGGGGIPKILGRSGLCPKSNWWLDSLSENGFLW